MGGCGHEASNCSGNFSGSRKVEYVRETDALDGLSSAEGIGRISNQTLFTVGLENSRI